VARHRTFHRSYGSTTAIRGFADATSREIAQPFQQIWCGEAIHDGRCGALPVHESGVKQHLQMLGRSGLLGACGVRDLPDGLFAPAKREKDPHTCGVAERARARRDEVDLFA
jgi:hypothetical protein